MALADARSSTCSCSPGTTRAGPIPMALADVRQCGLAQGIAGYVAPVVVVDVA
ncbi:hypothetical protein FB564_1530 [Salinispora arenicola]|uniref:Uncharacterized protein n=1 Tax=Salinispora arenicola TaxID=168697 RepID=A0A542XKP9_SALAC|nr:hypothetical protein FB564_1530 [Salinispora arenicola]